MTPRSPKSPARRALPPIYVVARGNVPLCGTAYTDRDEVARFVRHDGEHHLVKYLPAPVPPRSRKSKGGSK